MQIELVSNHSPLCCWNGYSYAFTWTPNVFELVAAITQIDSHCFLILCFQVSSRLSRQLVQIALSLMLEIFTKGQSAALNSGGGIPLWFHLAATSLAREGRSLSSVSTQSIDQWQSKYDPLCYSGKVTKVTRAAWKNQFQQWSRSHLWLGAFWVHCKSASVLIRPCICMPRPQGSLGLCFSKLWINSN